MFNAWRTEKTASIVHAHIIDAFPSFIIWQGNMPKYITSYYYTVVFRTVVINNNLICKCETNRFKCFSQSLASAYYNWLKPDKCETAKYVIRNRHRNIWKTSWFHTYPSAAKPSSRERSYRWWQAGPWPAWSRPVWFCRALPSCRTTSSCGWSYRARSHRRSSTRNTRYCPCYSRSGLSRIPSSSSCRSTRRRSSHIVGNP